MRPYWSIDHTENPRADKIIASEPFITIPPSVIVKVMTRLLVSLFLPPCWSIQTHQTGFIDCQKIGYNQSFFNFLGKISKDPLVLYANLIIVNKKTGTAANQTYKYWSAVDKAKTFSDCILLTTTCRYCISQTTVSHPMRWIFKLWVSNTVKLFLFQRSHSLLLFICLWRCLWLLMKALATFFQAVNCSLFSLGCRLRVFPLSLCFLLPYAWSKAFTASSYGTESSPK